MVMSLWKRFRRTDSGVRSSQFQPRIEGLEDRRVMSVSNILPGTLLSGQDEPTPTSIPPIAEGAIGTDWLVSVVNNRIQWRLKDGTGTVNTIDAGNLFGLLVPTDALTGNPITNPATGLALPAWDPNGGRGVAFPDVDATQQSVTVTGAGYDNTNGAGAFGMRVQYDQYYGRFIIIAENNQGNATSQVFVAVSLGEDPNSGFHMLSIESTFTLDPDGINVGTLGLLPHFTRDVQFGLSRDTIVITANSTGNNSGALFNDDARVFTVQKQQYYEGNATTVTRSSLGLANMRDLTTGLAHYNLKPTHNYGDDGTSIFILETFAGFGANSVDIFRIDNVNLAFWTQPNPRTVAGLSPGFTFPTSMIAKGDKNGSVLIDVNQYGRTNGITPGGGVVPQSAVWFGDAKNLGFGKLWFAHTLDNNDGRPDARWYEINTSTIAVEPTLATATLLQQGGVNADDVDGNAAFPVDTSAPEIIVNSFDDMAIAFAASNETLFVGAYYAGRFSIDRTDPRWGPTTNATTRPAKALTEGQDLYNRQVSGSGDGLWGWTSGVGFDPVNQDTFWTFNSYAATRPPGNVFGFWRTNWGAFQLVADTAVLMVDVSDSMGAIKGQDVDGDGHLTNADDANGDGLKGDLIDLAVFEINDLLNSGLLPGQPGNLADGRIVLVIFARDTQVIVLNPTAAGNDRFRVRPSDDSDANGEGDLKQAVDTLRVGSITFVNQFVVRTDRSNYCPPIEISAGLFFGATRITVFSDGSGRFDPACNIPVGTRIDTVKLGPYQTIANTSDFDQLSLLTDGTQFSVNNPPVPQDGGFTFFTAVDRLPNGFPFSVTVGPGGSSGRNGIYGFGPFAFVPGQPLGGGTPGGGGGNERGLSVIDGAVAQSTLAVKSRPRTPSIVDPLTSGAKSADSKVFVSSDFGDEIYADA